MTLEIKLQKTIMTKSGIKGTVKKNGQSNSEEDNSSDDGKRCS